MNERQKSVFDTAYKSRKRSTKTMKPKELEVIRVQTWYRSVLDEAHACFREMQEKALQTRNSRASTTPELSEEPDFASPVERLEHHRKECQRLSDRVKGLAEELSRANRLESPSELLQYVLQKCEKPVDDEHIDTLTNLRRQKYEDGQQSPTDTTLAALEAYFPGTREVYDTGPNGEPLWLVLAGDQDACVECLHVLFPPPKGQLSTSFEKKVAQLFEGILAPQWQISLEDVPPAATFGHPVWLSYTQTRLFEAMPVYEGEEEPELGEAQSERLLTATIDDLIVGAIAAWWLANERMEGPILQQEWLLMGLCQGVISQVYSEEIQQYVLRLLREKAVKIDKALSKYDKSAKYFEARWAVHVGIVEQLGL
ncbi:hypothetical protein B0T49_21785 [Chromobacterium violaceum]|uniref:hypothetical protein n=1 Tax=Chromobacterium violaceum TaxID=536 RepID=UPI0009DAB280|nr:hypothetical protein [Chromobacterium violaceum]OQS45189.1 hypothetical protein B0T49_21785 [Chromobacterium violaceum]OQS45781.1 hypothetical protein B0T48_17995 [Chromobacterium violaceum]